MFSILHQILIGDTEHETASRMIKISSSVILCAHMNCSLCCYFLPSPRLRVLGSLPSVFVNHNLYLNAPASYDLSLTNSYTFFFLKKLISLCRLIQNWWTRRKVRQEHGPERKINFPQWEKDYNLQPMNAYGLFDEYLEMSMETFYFILSSFILFNINANSSSLATFNQKYTSYHLGAISVWGFFS